MIKTTLYIGLNDKDTKKQKIPRNDAKAIIMEALNARGIMGKTFYDARGVWTYDDGDTDEEETIMVEVFGFPVPDDVIPVLKKKLNQESIGVCREEVKVVFV